MNVLALCAGIGGLELGIKLANPQAKTVCYVEGEAYAAAILVARMEEKVLDEAPLWSNVKTFDGNPWRGKVDCIAGGYPCTPFSLAGKRQGHNDERHLWPHFQRIVGEVQPRYCFFENVSHHLRMGFATVHDDLRKMGYRVAAGVFTATETGALHERERIFIMAYADRPRGIGVHERNEKRCLATNVADGRANVPDRITAAHSGEGIQEQGSSGSPGKVSSSWWGDEPAVGRLVDGTPNRVDRQRASGNAVVPLVAGYAWRTLADALGIN